MADEAVGPALGHDLVLAEAALGPEVQCACPSSSKGVPARTVPGVAAPRPRASSTRKNRKPPRLWGSFIGSSGGCPAVRRLLAAGWGFLTCKIAGG